MSLVKISAVNIASPNGMARMLEALDEPDYLTFKSKMQSFHNHIGGLGRVFVGSRQQILQEAKKYPWGLVGPSLTSNHMYQSVNLIGGDIMLWSMPWPDIAGALDAVRAESQRGQADQPSTIPTAVAPAPAGVPPATSLPTAAEAPEGAASREPDAPEPDSEGNVFIFDENLEDGGDEGDSPYKDYPPIELDIEEVEQLVVGLELNKSGIYNKDDLMPGIPVDYIKDFVSHLKNKGVSVSHSSINVRSANTPLKVGGLKYRSILRMLREPIENAQDGPIILSRELLLLEGNNRWATVYIADIKFSEEGREFSPDMKNSYIVDMPFSELLEESKVWAKSQGIRAGSKFRELEVLLDVEPDAEDMYDRFRFRPGGDLYLDIFNIGAAIPEDKDRVKAAWTEILNTFPQNVVDQALRAIKSLSLRYREEHELMEALRKEVDGRRESGGNSLGLEPYKAELYKLRSAIDELKEDLERFGRQDQAPDSEEDVVSIPGDILEIDPEELELEPIYAVEIKRGVRRAMIDRQSRFRAKSRLYESKGLQFDIVSNYFNNILEDRSLANYVLISSNDSGDDIAEADKGIFKKFIKECISHIDTIVSLSGGKKKVDAYQPVNDLFSALKLLEDYNIKKISSASNVSNPDAWLIANGVSIRDEVVRSEDRGEETVAMGLLIGRTDLFQKIFQSATFINGQQGFYEGDISDYWKRRYMGESVPPDLSGDDNIYEGFRSYVGNNQASQIMALFDRSDYIKWGGGEYESDLLLCRNNISQLRRNYLSDFISNRTPGYNLVKCPLCFKKKNIEFGMSGWSDYKELKEEYRTKLMADLYSPYTEGQNPRLISSSDFYGEDGNKEWTMNDASYTWSQILEMTKNNNNSIAQEGHARRSAVYSSLGAKLIKQNKNLSAIRFKCPAGLGDDGCGLDLFVDDANVSYQEAGVLDFQPTGSRSVKEETKHQIEVVTDEFDDMLESFGEFIQRHADDKGVAYDDMLSIISELNNIDPSMDMELFDEAGIYVIEHESLRQALEPYFQGDEINDKLLTELKKNNPILHGQGQIASAETNKFDLIIENKDIVKNLDNRSWSVMARLYNSGGIIVNIEELSTNKLHSDGGDLYASHRGSNSLPGFKFSRMSFPCPCHIDDPGIDASEKYSLLAVPHSGPVGFNKAAELNWGRPTSPSGEYSDIKFGTFGFLICGAPTSLSSFTRASSNLNNIRSFLNKNKVLAAEFLIENGVDVEDLRPFLEDVESGGIESALIDPTNITSRKAEVGRLFKEAMGKFFEGDITKDLEDLSLTCPHGHVFTIGQSWEFSSTNFGMDLQGRFARESKLKDKGDIKTSKFDNYRSIMRTSGIENLVSVLRSAGDGKGSGLFRRISEEDFNSDNRREWRETRDSVGFMGDTKYRGRRSRFKASSSISIPQITSDSKDSVPEEDWANHIFMEDLVEATGGNRGLLEEAVDALIRMRGNYSVKHLDLQAYINPHSSSYDASKMKRGKRIEKKVIEKFMISKAAGGLDEEGRDKLERFGTDHALKNVIQSSKSVASNYIDAKEFPIGRIEQYESIDSQLGDGGTGELSKFIKLRGFIDAINLKYKPLVDEAANQNKRRSLEIQRKNEIEGLLVFFGYISADASLDMSPAQKAMIAQALDQKTRSVALSVKALVGQQYEDLISGLRSYLNLIKQYYLNSMDQSTFSYLRSTSVKPPEYKAPPEPEEFSVNIKDMVTHLMDNGVLMFVDDSGSEDRHTEVGNFSSQLSKNIGRSLSGSDVVKGVNLNNVVFSIDKELDYTVVAGETFQDIASKFNVSTKTLKEWNYGKQKMSDEMINEDIRVGSVKSFRILTSLKASIRDLLASVISSNIASLLSGESSIDSFIELSREEGAVTESLISHVNWLASQESNDPEEVVYSIFYSLSREYPDYEKIADQVRVFSEPDESSQLFSSAVERFGFIEEQDDDWDPPSDELMSLYEEHVTYILNMLIDSGNLKLSSNQKVSMSKITDSVDSWISNNKAFSDKFSPDRISFGLHYKTETGGTFNESKIISGNIMQLAFALYLAEKLISVNNLYFKAGGSRYIGVDIGITNILSDSNSILKISDSKIDSLLYGSIDDEKINKLVEQFRYYAENYLTDSGGKITNKVWGPMAEAFVVMNNIISSGSASMSGRFTNLASEILDEYLRDNTDYFDDSMRSLSFSRASIFKTMPMSEVDGGYFYSPTVYGYSGAGSKKSVNTIAGLEDSVVIPSKDRNKRVVNERLNYDSRRMSIGRIGMPGTYDYQHPPKPDKPYEGSVGIVFPMKMGFKEVRVAKTRFREIGSSLIIPDFKMIIEVDDHELNIRKNYDISFLIRRRDSKEIYEKLSFESNALKELNDKLHKSEIALESARQDGAEIPMHLHQDVSLAKENILFTESNIATLQFEASQLPPDIRTSIFNRFFTGVDDFYNPSTIRHGDLISSPCMVLVDPYMAYRMIMNPDSSGSPYDEEIDKRALVRFIYDTYNYEPIARHIFKRNIAEDGSFNISFDEMKQLFDPNFNKSHKVPSKIRKEAKENPGRYYSLVSEDDMGSEMSYIRYMPTQFNRKILHGSLKSFRDAIDVSASPDNYTSMIKIQSILKNYDAGVDINKGIWTVENSKTLDQLFARAWCSGGSNVREYLLSLEGVDEAVLEKSMDICAPFEGPQEWSDIYESRPIKLANMKKFGRKLGWGSGTWVGLAEASALDLHIPINYDVDLSASDDLSSLSSYSSYTSISYDLMKDIIRDSGAYFYNSANNRVMSSDDDEEEIKSESYVNSITYFLKYSKLVNDHIGIILSME